VQIGIDCFKNNQNDQFSRVFLDWLDDECRANERRKTKEKQGKPPFTNGGTKLSIFQWKNVTDKCGAFDSERTKQNTSQAPSQVSLETPVKEAVVTKSDPYQYIQDCITRFELPQLEKELIHLSIQSVSNALSESKSSQESTEAETWDPVSVALSLFHVASDLTDSIESSNLAIKYIPLLSQESGDSKLWELMFGVKTKELKFAGTLVSRCASVWDWNHILPCQLWLLENGSNDDFTNCMNVSLVLRFMVVTCSQRHINSKSIRENSKFQELKILNSDTSVLL